MPILPFITDSPENILELVRLAEKNGARFIYPYFGVTLRNGQREYFYRKLDEAFPGQGIRQAYIKEYGLSYECHSPRARELSQLFTSECDRLGILYRMRDIIQAYKSDYDYRQLSFPL
jgi:hypothetical protein